MKFGPDKLIAQWEADEFRAGGCSSLGNPPENRHHGEPDFQNSYPDARHGVRVERKVRRLVERRKCLYMAYSDLIKHIFGEERKVISENEFLSILPEMMLRNKKPCCKWKGEMEIKLLVMRFGLCGEQPRTLKECAIYFGGYSCERIRQVQNMAIRVLRHPRNVCRFLVGNIENT